jgi:hypothetical protein
VTPEPLTATVLAFVKPEPVMVAVASVPMVPTAVLMFVIVSDGADGVKVEVPVVALLALAVIVADVMVAPV